MSDLKQYVQNVSFLNDMSSFSGKVNNPKVDKFQM
jgi:hypothetical protein